MLQILGLMNLRAMRVTARPFRWSWPREVFSLLSLELERAGPPAPVIEVSDILTSFGLLNCSIILDTSV